MGGGDHTPSEVVRSRQQLKDEAYKSVLKLMIGKDALDSALLSKMRMELGIEALNHRKWLQELMASKKNNTLFSSLPSSAPQPPAAAAAPAPSSRMQGVPSSSLAHTGRQATQRQQQQHHQQQQQQQQQPPEPKPETKASGVKPKKMKSLAAPAGQLLPEYIGRKVKRWWAKENAWFDGVITDFKQNNGGLYCITYGLGTKNESGEWLEIASHVQAEQLEILKDKVELRSYTNSRAVQSSSVLNPKKGGGMESSRSTKKKPSAPEVGPTGRKRSYAVFDDSDDMGDL